MYLKIWKRYEWKCTKKREREERNRGKEVYDKE